MSDSVETARRVIGSAAKTLQPGQDAGEHYARALADLGLLADPAQTTELEEIEDAVDEFQVRDADGPVPNVPLAEQVRVLFSEWADAVAERDQLRERKQADLDELKKTLGLTRNTLKQNVEWRDRFRAERDEDRAELGETRRERDLLLWLHAEAAWRVAGFDVLTVALARRNHRLTAERDERQARIDAANLIATRAVDEGLPADEALRMIARTLEGKTARALSGEALRDVEERDDAAGDLP